HSLLLVVHSKAVVKEFGALLAPVAGPVAGGGAVAVEAGKDVKGVGRGHGALLESGRRCRNRLGTTAKLTAVVPSHEVRCSAAMTYTAIASSSGTAAFGKTNDKTAATTNRATLTGS